jgi:protein-S-isoprenylcysteine O-methyltransferase Ste14
MALLYRYLIPAVWLSWAIYWWILARHNKVAVRRESSMSRLSHLGPLLIALWLLWAPDVPLPVLGKRFLPVAAWPFWTGFALTTAGIVFAVWARRHLGGNWSGIVTIKENHELIKTGPYAIVRHPVYTGLLLAFIGSAIARGDWQGLLAVALAAAAFYHKLRIEERWMREQFGAAYQEYSLRVPALVPYVF